MSFLSVGSDSDFTRTRLCHLDRVLPKVSGTEPLRTFAVYQDLSPVATIFRSEDFQSAVSPIAFSRVRQLPRLTDRAIAAFAAQCVQNFLTAPGGAPHLNSVLRFNFNDVPAPKTDRHDP